MISQIKRLFRRPLTLRDDPLGTHEQRRTRADQIHSRALNKRHNHTTRRRS